MIIMSEDAARFLGASKGTWKIAGKEYEIKAVNIRGLTEVGRECVKIFRRAYLENIKDTMELVGLTQSEFRRIVEDSAKWTVDDLPMKKGHDPKDIVISNELKSWLETELDIGEKDLEGKDEEQANEMLKRLVATSLDEGRLTPEEYEQFTGKQAKSVPINYVSWWITGTLEGMVEFAYAAFKDQELTREAIYDELGGNFAKLAELSREIESVTTPQMTEGNEESPTKKKKKSSGK